MYLAPLLVAVWILGFLRRPAWVAGLAALAAAIPGILSILPPSANALGFFVHESAKGLWLAWSPIAVIAAGIFFHHATDAHDANPAPLNPRSLFVISYLLGGFIESAIGFGVSFVVVVSLLRRSGLAPLPSILLGVFSHLFVPWGALATGAAIGAELGHESLQQLGLFSALFVAPIGLLTLPLYWGCLEIGDVKVSNADRIDDAVWLALLMAALIGAHFIVPTQLAGIASAGAIFVLRRWRDGPRDFTSLKAAIAKSAHYSVLCAALLASRLVPPLKDALQHAFVIKPFDDAPAFAPLYHPSAFLLGLGVAFGMTRGAKMTKAASSAWSGAWRPLCVTALFVTLANWLSTSGVAEFLAQSLIATTGPHGVALAPLMGGAAGFFTGSNVASNAMMMPIQVALDASGRLPAGLLAALQNVSGSMLTSLSPIRISMARALAGAAIEEREIYSKAWVFGAVALCLLCAAAAWFALRA